MGTIRIWRAKLAVAFILSLYNLRGGMEYAGEEVSVTEHSLQTLRILQNLGANRNVQVAGLLHDIGHLFAGELISHGIIARWLLWLLGFPPEVYESAGLHVDAKRFLCWKIRDYSLSLSADSARTLALQGGKMDQKQADAFRRLPFWKSAVRVRMADERGKVVGVAVGAIEDHRELLLDAILGR